MTFLSVQIVRLVDDSFPGWVDCEFTDVRGRHHTITEKYAVLTHKMLECRQRISNSRQHALRSFASLPKRERTGLRSNHYRQTIEHRKQ